MGGENGLTDFYEVGKFQYPLMDRLYFGGDAEQINALSAGEVSVSSDGSFVFWGAPLQAGQTKHPLSFSIL